MLDGFFRGDIVSFPTALGIHADCMLTGEFCCYSHPPYHVYLAVLPKRCKRKGDWGCDNKILSIARQISQKFIGFLMSVRIQEAVLQMFNSTIGKEARNQARAKAKKCPSFMSPKIVLKFAVKTSRTFSTIGPCRSQANSMRQKEIHHRRNQLLKS